MKRSLEPITKVHTHVRFELTCGVEALTVYEGRAAAWSELAEFKEAAVALVRAVAEGEAAAGELQRLRVAVGALRSRGFVFLSGDADTGAGPQRIAGALPVKARR